MSYFDYRVSTTDALVSAPFYALLMAAIRQADTPNTEKLKAAWPELWQEMYDRYNAPGGLLPGERSGWLMSAEPLAGKDDEEVRRALERVRDWAGFRHSGEVRDLAYKTLPALDGLAAQRDALSAENWDLNAENRDLLEKWSERGAEKEAAEAEVARLQEALREIERTPIDLLNAKRRDRDVMRSIARAALKGEM